MDDVLYEFDGQLTYHDIMNMTYKEIGYLRQHRKKHHPREMDSISKALLGAVGGRAPQGNPNHHRIPDPRGNVRPRPPRRKRR